MLSQVEWFAWCRGCGDWMRPEKAEYGEGMVRHKAWGLCTVCYSQVREDAEPKMPEDFRVCLGCERPMVKRREFCPEGFVKEKARQLCGMCYSKDWRALENAATGTY